MFNKEEYQPTQNVQLLDSNDINVLFGIFQRAQMMFTQVGAQDLSIYHIGAFSMLMPFFSLFKAVSERTGEDTFNNLIAYMKSDIFYQEFQYMIDQACVAKAQNVKAEQDKQKKQDRKNGKKVQPKYFH